MHVYNAFFRWMWHGYIRMIRVHFMNNQCKNPCNFKGVSKCHLKCTNVSNDTACFLKTCFRHNTLISQFYFCACCLQQVNPNMSWQCHHIWNVNNNLPWKWHYLIWHLKLEISKQYLRNIAATVFYTDAIQIILKNHLNITLYKLFPCMHLLYIFCFTLKVLVTRWFITTHWFYDPSQKNKLKIN